MPWLTGSAKAYDTYEQRYWMKAKYGYEEYHYGDLAIIASAAKISPRFGGNIKPIPIRVADKTGKGLSKVVHTSKVWKNNLKSAQKSIKSSSHTKKISQNLKKVAQNPQVRSTGAWLRKRPLTTGIVSGTIGGAIMSHHFNQNSERAGNLEWLVPRRKKRRWV